MARETYQGDDFHATWVMQGDALWEPLAARWSREIGKGRKPVATSSKYANGIGTFFRTDWISQLADRDYYR